MFWVRFFIVYLLSIAFVWMFFYGASKFPTIEELKERKGVSNE